MTNKLKMTFGYADTEETRQYAFDVADSIVASDIKTAVLSVNDSLKNHTDGGLSDFYVSEEGDVFTLITDAQLEVVNKTVLDLNITVEGGGESSVNP